MARFQEKDNLFKKHPKLEKAIFWSLMGLFSVIFVALIVIIVLMIIGPTDDEDEEETFEETYKTAELITFEDLAEFFNTDSTGAMPDGVENVCVYIYSPDYTEDEDGNVANLDAKDDLRTIINKVVDKLKDSDGIYNDYAFYVINITTDENEEYLAENTTFLSDHNIPTSNPVLVTLGGDASAANGIAVLEDQTFDANNHIEDLINYLYDTFEIEFVE